jgi:hypothetical protein
MDFLNGSKKMFLVLILTSFLVLLGCFGSNVPAPEINGKDCNTNPQCMYDAFTNNCELSYATLSNEQGKVFIQITGTDGNRCVGYVKLLEAKNIDSTIKSAVEGLNATCKLNTAEAQAFSLATMKNLNCEGPLWEAVKLYLTVSGQ